MKQVIELQDKYESYFSIVNYHALTSVRDKEQLSKDTMSAAMDYLAAGIDPKKVTLFVQADVPHVTELAWIFNTLITVPYLSRAVAYKDKTAQGLEATVGLFDYPVLMASDILIFDAEIVPVGADQKQHVEMARDIAQKFNQAYGETFTLPQVRIQESVATVPGIDGRKMSKSYGNTIPLFASRDELSKQVMSIVTDSSGARPEHVYAIHKLFKSEAELQELYDANVGNYKALKETLIEDIDAFIAPFRARRDELAEDESYVKKILAASGEKMRGKAEKKMKDVRKKAGIVTTY